MVGLLDGAHDAHRIRTLDDVGHLRIADRDLGVGLVELEHLRLAQRHADLARVPGLKHADRGGNGAPAPQQFRGYSSSVLDGYVEAGRTFASLLRFYRSRDSPRWVSLL